MSHETHKEIICPNCNSKAYGNYCAQCGQATHFHKETFLHLVGHFVGHYFHFENKFWVSLRTLIMNPGKLTMAWHRKQRMRYVAPVSLYIFTSVAFFILFSFTVKFQQVTTVTSRDGHAYMQVNYWLALGRYQFPEIKEGAAHQEAWVTDGNCDSLRQYTKDLKELYETNKIGNLLHEPFSFSFEYAYMNFFNYFVYPYAYRHKMYGTDEPVTAIVEEYVHLVPKVLFILMPLLAMLLSVIFRKGDEYYFVDHGVMSLHTHIFWFISIAVQLIIGSFINLSGYGWLLLFFLIIPFLHFLLACRRFYCRKWWYTLLMGSLAWTAYLFIVAVISVAILLLVICFT